ncbi:GNAT family N-acetyltransferase [Pseudidiomarina sp.]|uniref:GNAT family N-acetyltransferase n=1 Tax=Pseudidiomarina sp. TaxID=2081707 RepID=UPI003A96EA28
MITIRLATADDAPKLQQMIVQLAEGLGQSEDILSNAQNLAEIGLTQVPGFHAHIAVDTDTDQGVGLVFFFPEYSTWRGHAGVYIQDLYVDASQRGTGLGKKLLQAAARTGQQWQAKHLRLAVDYDNQAGRDFYTHVGFSEQPHYCITQLHGEAFINLLKANS